MKATPGQGSDRRRLANPPRCGAAECPYAPAGRAGAPVDGARDVHALDQPGAGGRAPGAVLVGVDLLHQGDFMADGQPQARAPKVNNPREAAAYSFGYNNTVFVQRVHDVLSVVRFVRTHEKKSKQVAILGVEGAGPIAAAARALAGADIDIAAIDSAGFRFGTVPDIFSLDLVPGGAKYLDLPGMLALSAPNRLWLGGETGSEAELVKNFYKTAGAEGALSLYNGSAEVATSQAVSWLLNQH